MILLNTAVQNALHLKVHLVTYLSEEMNGKGPIKRKGLYRGFIRKEERVVSVLTPNPKIVNQ